MTPFIASEGSRLRHCVDGHRDVLPHNSKPDVRSWYRVPLANLALSTIELARDFY